jgi:hypothetical protein
MTSLSTLAVSGSAGTATVSVGVPGAAEAISQGDSILDTATTAAGSVGAGGYAAVAGIAQADCRRERRRRRL